MSTVARPRNGPKRQAAAVVDGTKARTKVSLVAIPAAAKKAARQGVADKADTHVECAGDAAPRRSRRNAGKPAEDSAVSPIGPKPAVKSSGVARPKSGAEQAGATVVKGAVRQRIAALESTTLAPTPALSNNRRPIAQPGSRFATAKSNGVAKVPIPVLAEEAPAEEAPSAAGFIMSSPKRKPRASNEQPSEDPSTPENGPATKRRRADSDDEGTPKHSAAVPGFHSPLLKRMRPASAADSSDESSPSVKRIAGPQSRWARRFAQDASESEDSPSSPLKSILSPVLDLLRRVSGIAQGPAKEEEEEGEEGGNAAADVFVCQMPGALDADAGPLTAPPMNPAIGVAPYPACMQLYLPDAHDADSCSASPVTAGYPETPSKENIPVFGAYDFNAANDEITALSSVALATARPAGTPAGESDLDLSQISSLADSDIDAQYEQYLYDEDEDEFNPYLFMADLPPIPREHTLRPYALPRKTRSTPPITLVLDLDETLVHCALTAVENADLVFPVEYNGLNYDVYCRLRPGYREFLERASALFEVVVFTASQQVYADRLLNLIDPERRFIRHRLFRDSCVYVNTNYVKDLGILGRDEKKMVLVDNCPQAFAYQQSNGIPIESWYEDKADRELAHLMSFLETLVGDDDVRPKVEAHFKTREKVADAKKRLHFKLSAPIYVRGPSKN